MTLPYTHLTLAERHEIYRLRSAQIPVAVIAQRLGRHPSTIYREISRNWMHDDEPLYQGYFHVAADMQARARRQSLGKLSRHPALAVHVIDCLKAAWLSGLSFEPVLLPSLTLMYGPAVRRKRLWR
jgi:IS30 family transposase